MEKKYYSADCGSLSIECGGSFIDFHNGYGDGDFACYLFESDKEFRNWLKENTYKEYSAVINRNFLTSCYFKNARVLNSDCINHNQKINSEDVIFTLNGAYAIYRDYGDMYLVKWEE